MAEQQQKFPTEIIDLPSEGKLYPEGHPLKDGKVEIKNTRSVSTLVVFVTDEKASEEAWSTLDQKVSWYIEDITNDDGGYNIYEASDGLLELKFPIP